MVCESVAKPGCLNFDVVNAIGKTLRDQIAVRIRGEGVSILVRFADDLHCGANPKSRGIGDFKPEFAVIGLAKGKGG